MSIEGTASSERGRVDIQSGRIHWGRFALVAGAALLLDLATKRFVQEAFHLGEHRPILGAFRLQYEVNDGVAFGLLSGRQSLIVPAAAVAFLVIIAYVVLDRRPIAAVAGGLMAGGSLGNLAERIADGHVTDFLHLPYWPTFNVADTCIVVGVVLMGLSLLLDLRAGPGSED